MAYIKQILCYTEQADMWGWSAIIQREKEEDMRPWANKVKWKKPRPKKVVSWYPLLQGCGEHFNVSTLPHKNPEQTRSCLQQHLRGTQWCPLPSPWTLRPRRSASQMAKPSYFAGEADNIVQDCFEQADWFGTHVTFSRDGTSALLSAAHYATHHWQSYLIIT